MLSKKERAWLNGTFHPSEGYKRFLRHSIRKKLSNALSDLGVLTGSPHVREFSNELARLASLLSAYYPISYKPSPSGKQSPGWDSNPHEVALQATA